MKRQNNSEKKTAEADSKKIDGRKSRHAHAKANTSETFWNLLRIENGLTLRDISEMTGLKVGSISAWFTGRYMPNDYEMKVLCELFSVPIEEGKFHFERGYNTFHHRKSSNQPPEKAVEYVAKDVEKYKVKTEPKPEVIEEVLEEKHKPVGKSLIEKVYGKISYDTFDNLVTIMSLAELNASLDCTDAILKEIYGKVEYDDYFEIMKLIGRID